MHTQMSSPVLSPREVDAIITQNQARLADDFILVARQPIDGKLRYAWDSMRGYLEQYCGVPDNQCSDGMLDSDCTHFVCHALNKASVFVRNPSESCASGLCIRANDLLTSFRNSVVRYSNVTQISAHSDTRVGDFCFIPRWFGLRNHLTILAERADASGARVWGHTNSRCGDKVQFEGTACAYFRILDAA